jgi:hypothetical protein
MAELRIGRRAWLATLGSAAAAFALRADAAEAPRIEVGPIRRIGPDGVKHVEPWIAANPRDGSNLVIVSTHFLGEKPTRATFWSRPAAYASADGGETWTPATFEDGPELDRGQPYFADAYATFAPDGAAFCVFCGSHEGAGLDLRVYRSDDGGRRWRGPATIAGRGLDYPRLVADMAGGKPRLFLAVATSGDHPVFGAARRPGYGCAVLRSDDGARTFAAVNFLAPTRLQHDPIDSPLVFPDGRLLVGFTDYPGAAEGGGRREHLALGRTYTSTSRDGGATFSLPAPVAEAPIWGGSTVLAADASGGPRRGRVYAVTCRKAEGPPRLQVQASGDGVDWTAPTPIAGLGPGPILYAAAAVSSRGVLGVAWLQGEPGTPLSPADKALGTREFAWSLHFTASADGGATFAAPATVLDAPSHSDPSLPRWAFGTDYLSLAAPADGSFRLLWVDTKGGKGELRTARIEARP